MNISLKDLPAKFLELLNSSKRYAVVVFILLVIGVYGFLVMRVNSLQTAQPSTVDGAAPVTPVATPHIDEKVIKQLQQLQDNSVQVKSLFDGARSNPFKE